MEMQMEFVRKLPTPKEIKELYPITDEMKRIKEDRDREIIDIFTGKSDKFLLIIGPCSADNEEAVVDYMHRLAKVHDKVSDRIFIIPRIYTNKPRTTGTGYKGMLHQPDPEGHEDMLGGIVAIRHLHTRILAETGFTGAEEMLYPNNHRYLSDLLSYTAIGARSVEDQEHRIVSSGVGIPVGMKNPPSGDLTVMMNAITAAQSPQDFIYRGWEVRTNGNPLAHAIMRGYINNRGECKPNYHYENLMAVYDEYQRRTIRDSETLQKSSELQNSSKLRNPSGLQNPSIIVDTNHANSNKKYLEQIRIAKDVMHSRRVSEELRGLVKGLMIESYIEDGNQKIGEGVYGKSITDPCLGWEKTEKLIYELAEMV